MNDACNLPELSVLRCYGATASLSVTFELDLQPYHAATLRIACKKIIEPIDGSLGNHVKASSCSVLEPSPSDRDDSAHHREVRKMTCSCCTSRTVVHIQQTLRSTKNHMLTESRQCEHPRAAAATPAIQTHHRHSNHVVPASHHDISRQHFRRGWHQRRRFVGATGLVDLPCSLRNLRRPVDLFEALRRGLGAGGW